MYENLTKSLRWLAFMFPEKHPAEDDIDRISNNIHLYCSEGADAIEELSADDRRRVVFCKDCIHYEMGACLKIYDDGNASSYAWQARKPEDFCSYGESREEE